MTPEELGAFEAEQAAIRSGPHRIISGNVAIALTPDEVAEFHALEAAATAAAVPNAKASAIKKVNRDCGAFRASLATDIPFQSEVYAEKRGEAERYASTGGVGTFPFLAAEAAATGVTLAQMASEILAIAAQWQALSVAVEAKRRGSIVAIGNATTVEQVQAAVPENWP